MRPGIDAANDLAQVGVAPHRGEQSRGPEGVVAGPRRNAYPDPVGFQLLRSGKTREREPRPRDLHGTGFRVARRRVDIHHQLDLAHLFFANCRMPGQHMRHFVRHHGGELGAVVGKGEHSPRHVKLPAGQREGIDVR